MPIHISIIRVLILPHPGLDLILRDLLLFLLGWVCSGLMVALICISLIAKRVEYFSYIYWHLFILFCEVCFFI